MKQGGYKELFKRQKKEVEMDSVIHRKTFVLTY